MGTKVAVFISDFVHIFSVVFAVWTVLEWFLPKVLPLGNHGFIAAITLKNDEPNFVCQISDSIISVVLFRYTTWCLTYESE